MKVEKAFRDEAEWIRDEWLKLEGTREATKGLIQKMLGMVRDIELQNVFLRSELMIYDHPRWRLIPSFEFMTVLDCSKVI